MAEYRVGRNSCNCHPETCGCSDWVILHPDGDVVCRIYSRETADFLAESLNLLEVYRAAHPALRQLLAKVVEERDAYRNALEMVKDPILEMQRKALRSGLVIDGELARSLNSDPGYYRGIAQSVISQYPEPVKVTAESDIECE